MAGSKRTDAERPASNIQSSQIFRKKLRLQTALICTADFVLLQLVSKILMFPTEHKPMKTADFISVRWQAAAGGGGGGGGGGRVEGRRSS